MNAGFGCAVQDVFGVGRLRFNRADVDDAAVALLQVWQCGLDEKYQGTHVDIGHLVPFRRYDVGDAAFPHHPTVIDQDIQSTEVCDGVFYQSG